LAETSTIVDTPADLSALKAQFRARGFYRKPTGRILLQLLLHGLTAGTGLVLIVGTDGFWPAALGVVMFTAGQVGLATNTHTSAHFATSNRRWLNQALTYLGYPLMLGLGATYWWSKHNAWHHGSPNVLEVDEDIQLKPWFAFSQDEVRSAGPLARLYYRVQWISLPVIMLMSLQLQLSSVRYLLRTARSPRGWTGAHWLDAALLALSWTLWVGLPLAVWPAWDVVGFTAMRLVVMSCTLFAVFAPAHMPAEAHALHDAQRGDDPILLQTSTTLNFRTGALGAWLISGLQFQIEHHLFPGVSHVYYPSMSSLVADFCRRNGYPYRTLGWGEGLWKTFAAFAHPRPVTDGLQRLI
jgi:linoleoyl-CoA desaturase